jgi:hypothetical protein
VDLSLANFQRHTLQDVVAVGRNVQIVEYEEGAVTKSS